MGTRLTATLLAAWLSIVCLGSPVIAQSSADNSPVDKGPPRIEQNVTPRPGDEMQGGPATRQLTPSEPFVRVPSPGCPYRNQQLELVV